MRIAYLPCVEIDDLEHEIELQYSVKVDIAELFNFLNNDCYEVLCFAEYCDEDHACFSWDSPEKITQRNLVRAHLRDIFPNEDTLLVSVSY